MDVFLQHLVQELALFPCGGVVLRAEGSRGVGKRYDGACIDQAGAYRAPQGLEVPCSPLHGARVGAQEHFDVVWIARVKIGGGLVWTSFPSVDQSPHL